MRGKYLVGTDIGGTFTDIVLVGEGRFYRRKLLSTTDDFSIGVIAGIKDILSESGISSQDIDRVVHGTTVATNAILEHKGAKTALITTKGFRDILELRLTRAKRDPLRGYVTDLIVPKPLVPRYLRVEVDERINHKGEIVRPLNMEEVQQLIQRLADDRIEAVAVCLLNSFENPAHEQAIGKLIREESPDIYLSLSSEVLPQIREYDRTSTTVINSYVGPTIQHYLNLLAKGLSSIDINAPLLIVESSGGIMSADVAALRPMHIIESGPSAGVIASHNLARKYGFSNVIALDMGGTTTKATMIEKGEISKKYKYSLGSGMNISTGELGGEGYPLSVPTIDIAEIGAGGGSIIWIDKGGLMRVGPQSAGATPGPACYDQGGNQPTLTDANVTLGYLSSKSLAGGGLKLAASKAYDVIERNLAKPLGLSVVEASYGSYLIAVSNMGRAVKAISVERGRDLRDYTLFAFGGCGPAYAAELARSLAMKRTIVPRAAGIFSALGLIVATVEHSLSRSYITPLDKVDHSELEQAFQKLEGEILSMLASERYEAKDATVQRLVDMRYVGQASTLTVPVALGTINKGIVSTLRDAFGQEYEKTYTITPSGSSLELVNLRVVGTGHKQEGFDPFTIRVERESRVKPSESYRKAYFGPEYGFIKTPVLKRSDLPSKPENGPLLIEEYDSTTVVPPMTCAYLDEMGSINIEILSGGE